MSDTRPQSSTSIVERLRFDAVRCELHFSKGVASNIEEGIAEIERLIRERDEWKQAAQVEAGERRSAHAEVERLRAALGSLGQHTYQGVEGLWHFKSEYDPRPAFALARHALLARRSFSEGGEGK